MTQKEDLFQCEVDFSLASNFGPFAWMVRPCEWYLQEYKDCKSIRGRVHQYFVSGSADNCDSWRDDYYNCSLFRKTQDKDILNRVIDSELLRKENRKMQSNQNTVWQYRDDSERPPSDWNKPVTRPKNST